MVNLNTVNIEVELSTKTISGEVAIPAKVQGLEGKSAYQLALDAGFVGTLEEWLASLKGEQGVSGVYTGTDTPPDGYDVWINPNGEAMTIVSSVNGKTGEVELGADDVGALSDSEILTNGDILAIWNSF